MGTDSFRNSSKLEGSRTWPRPLEEAPVDMRDTRGVPMSIETSGPGTAEELDSGERGASTSGIGTAQVLPLKGKGVAVAVDGWAQNVILDFSMIQ